VCHCLLASSVGVSEHYSTACLQAVAHLGENCGLAVRCLYCLRSLFFRLIEVMDSLLPSNPPPDPFRRSRGMAMALVLAAVGFLGGCSSWSLSASPGKLNGLFFWKDRDASLRAKAEADTFPSAAEAGLSPPRAK
jgi:hypothetical protein